MIYTIRRGYNKPESRKLSKIVLRPSEGREKYQTVTVTDRGIFLLTISLSETSNPVEGILKKKSGQKSNLPGVHPALMNHTSWHH